MDRPEVNILEGADGPKRKRVQGSDIPEKTRAFCHVLREEGLSYGQIGQQANIAKSSASGIIKEDTSEYDDEIERQRRARHDAWIRNLDKRLDLAESLIDLVQIAAKQAGTTGSLKGLLDLTRAGVDLRQTVRDASICQEKALLLEGKAATISETHNVNLNLDGPDRLAELRRKLGRFRRAAASQPVLEGGSEKKNAPGSPESDDAPEDG